MEVLHHHLQHTLYFHHRSRRIFISEGRIDGFLVATFVIKVQTLLS